MRVYCIVRGFAASAVIVRLGMYRKHLSFHRHCDCMRGQHCQLSGVQKKLRGM